MAKHEPMMPEVSHPKTKAGGAPYTEHDKEFHELEKNGGIRAFQYIPYPAMRYRGAAGDRGETILEYILVNSEREDDEKAKEGWIADQVKAKATYDKAQENIAQVAAEVAYTAERKMSPKARDEYRKRSAESEDHITE